MPLYEYQCSVKDCPHVEEVLCKYEEREAQQLSCPMHVDAPLVYRVGSSTTINTKGKYGMQAIFTDGTKKRVNNIASDRKRSDM